jgi:hypothetical protein
MGSHQMKPQPKGGNVKLHRVIKGLSAYLACSGMETKPNEPNDFAIRAYDQDHGNHGVSPVTAHQDS